MFCVLSDDQKLVNFSIIAKESKYHPSHKKILMNFLAHVLIVLFEIHTLSSEAKIIKIVHMYYESCLGISKNDNMDGAI